MDIDPAIPESEPEMPLSKAVGYVLLGGIPLLVIAVFFVGMYAKTWYEGRGPAYNPTVVSEECHEFQNEVGFALSQTLDVLHRGSTATDVERRAAAERLRGVLPDEESAQDFERWASTHPRELGMAASDQLWNRKKLIVKAHGCPVP